MIPLLPFAFLWLLILSHEAYPESTDPSGTVTIGTYGGIEYGMARELVYFSTPSASYYKVSELDWPLAPSYYVGAHLSLLSPFGLSADLNLKCAIPTLVGSMEDSDYLNGDGVRTNYSQHTGALERHLAARADLGWRLPLSSGFALTPYARLAVLDIKWSASDGYYQYPPEISYPYTPWSPSEPKVYLFGPIAYYEQFYVIPAVGLRSELDFNPALSLGASIAFSPLVSINDIDNHLLRSLTFYDSMTLATYVEPSLHLSFRPSKAVELVADLAYISIVSPKNGAITTEDTTTGSVSTSTGSGSSSGASLGTVSAAFGIHLRK